MKRFLALFLPFAMICALLVPFAMAENDSEESSIIVVEPDSEGYLPPSSTGGQSSPSVTQPDSEGCLPPDYQNPVTPPSSSVGGQTSVGSPGSSGQTPSGTHTGTTNNGSNHSVTQHTSGKNPSSYINFGDLRSLLTRYNSNVKALNAGIKEADNADKSALKGALAQFDELLNNTNASLSMVSTMINNPMLPPEQLPIYAGLATALGDSVALLSSQRMTLQGQLDSMDSTLESTTNTLNDTINQIVKGAETLYVAIITMQSATEDIQRGIESLDRAVALVEKQVELGMASEYDAESMRHQRSTVQSQLESLEYQIKTSKITLEGMLGMSLNGTVSLNPLAMPTAAELAAVNYDAQLNTAMRRNTEVKNAQLKDEDSDSNSYSYNGAKETFAYKFKLICLAIPEQQRLVQVAQENLDFQQRTLEIAARKYQLGMLSHEEYLAAENDVKSAGSSLFTAQLDLFTAYRNYVYAYQYGIV